MNSEFSQYNYQSPKNLLGYPIPDTILVFGEFSKHILLCSLKHGVLLNINILYTIITS